jgi:hypothetical protein
MAVALAFAAPFGAGVAVDHWFATRHPGQDRFVGLLYVWAPLVAATAVAIILRSEL